MSYFFKYKQNDNHLLKMIDDKNDNVAPCIDFDVRRGFCDIQNP